MDPIIHISAEKRSHLGMSILLQGLALFEHKTVEKNISYPLERRGVEKNAIKERVLSAMKRFKILDLSNRLPSNLSGGQRQRVALARSIIYEPRLILLDEPFRGLQPELRDQFLAFIRNLSLNGTAVLIVSHDQRDLLMTSDSILVMEKGGIVSERKHVNGQNSLHFQKAENKVMIPITNLGSINDTVFRMDELIISQLSVNNSEEYGAFDATVLDKRFITPFTLAVLLSNSKGNTFWLEKPCAEVKPLNIGQNVKITYPLNQKRG